MFCSTVSHGKTPYSWKITPRSGPGPVISRPAEVTRPALGRASPAASFNSEVLPQPDGPSSDRNSPRPSVSDTSSTAQIPPVDVA